MRITFLSGVVAALVCAGAARAGVVENFNVEDWGGLAYADDTTGKIANCSVYAANQKGATLLFIKNADESWFFSLTDDDWKLTSGSEYPVRYKIDGRRTVDATAQALSETQLGIYMAKDDPFFGQVRRGNMLTFTFEAESYPFNLGDSGLALDAAQGCLERHKRTDAEVAAAPEAVEVETESAAAPASAEPAVPAPAPTAEDDDVAAATATPDADSGSASGDVPAAMNPPMFGDVEMEAIEVPGWEAAAFADAAGTFTHCAIRAEYENGTTLAFARMADRSVVMTLAREDWSTQTGSSLPITYTYKGRDLPVEVTADAQAPVDGLLAVNMGKDDLIVADLKSAPEIVVKADGKTLTFDITDIGPGLEAVEACLVKHGAPPAILSSAKKKPSSSKKVAQADPAMEQAEPTASEEPPPEPQPADEPAEAPSAPAEAPAADAAAEIKVEASDFTTSLLGRSGYGDHVMLTGDAIPESMRSRASAWQIGEIIGVTDIVGGSVAEIRQQLEATDKKDCAGTFRHELASETEGKGAHVFSSCTSATLNLNIHYVILPRPAEGFYLLSFIAFAPGSAVDTIAAKVFEAARDG